MQWAEKFGVGELGLMPWEFWHLTVREFWIKHDAFIRDEGRKESAWLRHAVRTKRFKASDKNALIKEANRLKRYPVKPWLMEDN